MHTQQPSRMFRGFHLTVAVVIFIQSITTAISAIGQNPDAQTNWLLFILASVETIAAVLLIIPKTTKVGGLLLMLILTIAFTIHLIVKDPQLHLLVYLASVGLILSHYKQVNSQPKIS